MEECIHRTWTKQFVTRENRSITPENRSITRENRSITPENRSITRENRSITPEKVVKSETELGFLYGH
jgi:hypothetical protein